MKQEDKELLLKDLCARLPYKLKVHIKGDYFYDEREPYDTTLKSEILGHFIHLDNTKYSVKPYLRSISSMAEEEKHELYQVFQECPTIIKIFPAYAEFFIYADIINSIDMVNVIDWLNAHCFDYRGLIGKGLALEAPEGMYNLK